MRFRKTPPWNFEYLFLVKMLFRIEKVKVTIRKIINRKFSENKIV